MSLHRTEEARGDPHGDPVRRRAGRARDSAASRRTGRRDTGPRRAGGVRAGRRAAEVHPGQGAHGAPKEAVAGIDFTVRRGEAFGFLGPNGAGKSTTMR
jgi:ABC-type glutathione transport system ATPase component